MLLSAKLPARRADLRHVISTWTLRQMKRKVLIGRRRDPGTSARLGLVVAHARPRRTVAIRECHSDEAGHRRIRRPGHQSRPRFCPAEPIATFDNDGTLILQRLLSAFRRWSRPSGHKYSGDADQNQATDNRRPENVGRVQQREIGLRIQADIYVWRQPGASPETYTAMLPVVSEEAMQRRRKASTVRR
jgi:hypothetical protein